MPVLTVFEVREPTRWPRLKSVTTLSPFWKRVTFDPTVTTSPALSGPGTTLIRLAMNIGPTKDQSSGDAVGLLSTLPAVEFGRDAAHTYFKEIFLALPLE
jgi:hypothetical protein